MISKGYFSKKLPVLQKIVVNNWVFQMSYALKMFCMACAVVFPAKCSVIRFELCI
jgi:hypothetical protein